MILLTACYPKCCEGSPANHSRNPSNNLNNKGTSLVELMVALLISSFLLISIVSAYLHLKADHIYAHEQLSLFSNLRVADYLFKKFLRSAAQVKIYKAHNDVWQPSLPKSLHARVKSGNDVIIVQQPGKNRLQLLAMPNSRSLHVAASALTKSLRKGDLLFISDYIHTERFKLLDIYEIAGRLHLHTERSLHNTYSRNAQLGLWLEHSLFLKKSSALSVQKEGGKVEELVPGIDAMKIDWRSTTAKQKILAFELLAISEYPINNNCYSYTFSKRQYDSCDKWLRRPWVTHVQLRNI